MLRADRPHPLDSHPRSFPPAPHPVQRLVAHTPNAIAVPNRIGTATVFVLSSSQRCVFWGGLPGGGGVGGGSQFRGRDALATQPQISAPITPAGLALRVSVIEVHDVVGREAQIGQVVVDVRDEVVLPGVEPGVRARHIVVGHNSLHLCELTATAASGPHCRRAEWPVSTSIGHRHTRLDQNGRSGGFTQRPEIQQTGHGAGRGGHIEE